MTADAPSDQDRSRVVMELGNNCVACGSDRTRGRYEVPETMYRTGDSFIYRECDVCGSLQIDTVPSDLAVHYDSDHYYSFAEPNPRLQRGWLRWPPTRVALRLNTDVYLRTGFGRGFSWARKAGIRPEECGFLLSDVFYDSDAFQFFGSELVRSGEAFVGRPTERFSAEQMAAWATEAERLNRTRDGDQACFILQSAQH
jgi:hypothetical protein